jgi:hypothetical protein
MPAVTRTLADEARSLLAFTGEAPDKHLPRRAVPPRQTGRVIRDDPFEKLFGAAMRHEMNIYQALCKLRDGDLTPVATWGASFDLPERIARATREKGAEKFELPRAQFRLMRFLDLAQQVTSSIRDRKLELPGRSKEDSRP